LADLSRIWWEPYENDLNYPVWDNSDQQAICVG
jgi:hypothetical protein